MLFIGGERSNRRVKAPLIVVRIEEGPDNYCAPTATGIERARGGRRAGCTIFSIGWNEALFYMYVYCQKIYLFVFWLKKKKEKLVIICLCVCY